MMVQEEGNPSTEDQDDGPDQQPPKRYTFKEFNEAMTIVEGFFQYQNGKEAEEMHHYALKMQSWATRHPPRSSQTSLDRFL